MDVIIEEIKKTHYVVKPDEMEAFFQHAVVNKEGITKVELIPGKAEEERKTEKYAVIPKERKKQPAKPISKKKRPNPYKNWWQRISWRTVFLATIILGKNGNSDSKGRFIDHDDLLGIDVGEGTQLNERQIRARVIGANRVAKANKLPDVFFFDDKPEKRVYLSKAWIKPLHDLLSSDREEYDEFLERNELEIAPFKNLHFDL